jgi:hypothetical protein
MGRARLCRESRELMTVLTGDTRPSDGLIRYNISFESIEIFVILFVRGLYTRRVSVGNARSCRREIIKACRLYPYILCLLTYILNIAQSCVVAQIRAEIYTLLRPWPL